MAKATTEAKVPTAETGFELLHLGRKALGVTSTDLAGLLGVSTKSTWRWLNGRTDVGASELGRLAALVHPRDPALAARIHAHACAELGALNLRPPPPLPVAAPEPVEAPAAPAVMSTPPLPVKPRVDAVVFAACTAGDATPRAMLPALLAAFRRARELGLSVEDVESELAPPAAPKPVKKEKETSRQGAKVAKR